LRDAAVAAGFSVDICQSPGDAPWIVALCRKQ
jgi:hypothetical protein